MKVRRESPTGLGFVIKAERGVEDEEEIREDLGCLVVVVVDVTVMD